MARPNRLRGGRPTDDERAHIRPIPEIETPASDIHYGDRKVWIEGELTISHADEPMFKLLGNLDGMLKHLTTGRRDEWGTPVHEGGLFLTQVMTSADGFGNPPRHTADRRGQPKRKTRAEFIRMIAEHPGRTIPELAVELYPNGQGDPREREGSLRMQLWRMARLGSVKWIIDESGRRPEKRYYATTVVPVEKNQKHQLIEAVIKQVAAITPFNVGNLVRALTELIDHNAGRIDDLWRDPRGMIFTAIEYTPAFDGDPGPPF